MNNIEEKNQANISKKKIDILLIENLKYPLVFLVKFCLLIDNFSDEEACKIIKTFYKYHSDITMKINTKIIFSKCKNINKYKKCIKAIDDYYSLINNRLKIIYTIKKWETLYYNKYFWKLSIDEQIEYLNNKKIIFLSVFDCSANTVNIYYIKINEILNDPRCNRDIIIENIKDRLTKLIKIFGYKIFETLEIPLYHSSDFNYLENDFISLYLRIIFNKLLLLINQTICVFNMFQKNCNEINNYLNIEN